MKTFFTRTWRLLGLRGTLFVLICLLLLIAGLQNMDRISINFLFWRLVEVSKPVFMLGVFVIGLISGVLLVWRRRAPEY